MTGTQKGKKLFVKTYGCQMNEYDSDRLFEVMGEIGFTTTDDMEQADVIVLNTCHIREKAAEKVYSELGRIKLVRNRRLQEGFDTTIVVAGCVAQAEGREILSRAPVVNIVIGPQSFHRLPTGETAGTRPVHFGISTGIVGRCKPVVQRKSHFYILHIAIGA